MDIPRIYVSPILRLTKELEGWKNRNFVNCFHKLSHGCRSCQMPTRQKVSARQEVKTEAAFFRKTVRSRGSDLFSAAENFTEHQFTGSHFSCSELKMLHLKSPHKGLFLFVNPENHKTSRSAKSTENCIHFHCQAV